MIYNYILHHKVNFTILILYLDNISYLVLPYNDNKITFIVLYIYIIVYIIVDDNYTVQKDKGRNKFSFGQFKCPVIWSTKFALHPRLQHSTSMLLLGVQVLHTVLDKFSVCNRRNMFVYKDSTGSVFYLRYIFNLTY